MRLLIFTACLIVGSAGASLQAAPPVFHDQSATPAKAKTSWRLPSFGWFSSKQKPAPTVAPLMAEKPSTTQRIKNTFKNNPIATAMRPAKAKAPAPPTDALSLSRPAVPPSADMMVTMAKLAVQSGDLAAARGLFQQALAENPNNATVLRQYGRLEDNVGRLAEAEALYRRAVAVAPQNANAMNDLALCLARQNRLDESAAVFEQAIVLNPAKPLYRNNVAKVLVVTGNVPRAGAHLSAVHPPAIAQFNLGQLLLVSGRQAEAAQCLERAVALDPSFEPAKASLARLQQSRLAARPTGVSPIAPTQPTLPALPPTRTAAPPQPATPPMAAPPTAAPTTPLPTIGR